jgi:hypothetical protein
LVKQQEPVILWNDAGVKPKLVTEADRLKAGEMVFDAPILYSIEKKGGFQIEDVRNSAWYEKSGMPLTPNGILPFMHYVIREKGRVELGSFSCGMCHTRVMSGGKIVKGAQGNLPFGPALAQSAAFPWPVWQELFAMPWLDPDPLDRLKPMSDEQVRALLASAPPGTAARHRGSLFEPIQVPSLIGVKDRHYLDRTGLQQQHSIIDLMRYAALNQGADFLASFDGFIPDDIPNFKTLPDPSDSIRVGGRYRTNNSMPLPLRLFASTSAEPE